MSSRPRPVVSCDQCLAWGVPDRAGRCLPCRRFSAHNPGRGACQACQRMLPLKQGCCRLCWCQARLDRGPRTRHCELLPFVQNVRHHQLFLAGMPGPRDTIRERRRQRAAGTGGSGVRPEPGAPVPGHPPPGPVQLPLIDGLRRSYRPRCPDWRREPVADNPWLAWALHLADTMAETRGFSDIVHGALNRNLVMLLAGHRDGERIRYSDYHPVVVRQRNNSATHVTEVLHTMGILIDDRADTFSTWLADKLATLNPAIRRDVQRWAHTLRNGGPRVRRREPDTIRLHIYHIHAALIDWSHRYDHLREVTRADILAALASHRGFTRIRALVALRSLFTWAKHDGLIFANPTTGIKNNPRERPILQPLTDQDIARAVHAATTPQARLFLTLAVIYAARTSEICAILLEHVDLGNRRITIAGRDRPIDDLTRHILTEWLNHRRSRWPNTANPHLLINQRTAIGIRPITGAWMQRLLRGQPATIERLRITRTLDEALACGADPLHLAAVFNLNSDTAIRYARSARQLLQHPHETRPATSPRTQGSTLDTAPNTPSGSS